MSAKEEIVLFSPLPVAACRERLADATLPSRGSPVAGRVRGATIELWRRHSVWRLFQPALIVQMFAADGRTRLETDMRVSTSGVHAPVAFLAGLGVNLGVVAHGWHLLGYALIAGQAAVLGLLRARSHGGLAGDGPFLREQLERLVHASVPAH